MTTVSIKVVIDAAHMNAQEAVCKAVSDVGMKVEQSIPEIGAIFGSADESLVEQLGAVDGVLRAQREGAYKLPPLDPHVPQ